jgi:zinc protease
VVASTVNAGTGDTATVSMLFTSTVDDVDAAIRVRADVASQVLSARLTDVLREEFGESYSPFAISYISNDPDPAIETYVSVSGAPGRVGEIEALVIDEFADLAAAGPTEREFSNAFAQVEESYNFVDNSTFVEELMSSQLYATSDLDDYIFEFAALQSTTADDIRSYIATHVPADQYIEVTVVPR